nr:hypothetical protein [uncultured Clostridium sp.]
MFKSRDLNIRGNKSFKKRLHIVIICVLLLTLTGCNQIIGLFSFSNTFSITLDTTENISKTQLKLKETDILQLLKKELKELRGETYEIVQDKLVEIASVYGNMLIKKLGGRWKYNKHIAKTGLDITLCRWINVLEVFDETWQKGKEDLIIEEYNYRCSRVIPWVSNCRKLYGEEWQPPSASAEWEIPPM